MAICKPSEQYLNQLRTRYRKATKKQRGRMLDELVATTGCHRKHAIALLRGKRQHRNPHAPIRRPRQQIYTDENKRAVLWLAYLFDEIGSRRLRAAMNVELRTWYQRHHFQVCRACFKRLQVISPATMDRLRHTERRDWSAVLYDHPAGGWQVVSPEIPHKVAWGLSLAMLWRVALFTRLRQMAVTNDKQRN